MQTPSLPPLELELLCRGGGQPPRFCRGLWEGGGQCCAEESGSSLFLSDRGARTARGQSSSRVLPGRGRGCLGVHAAAAYSLASGDGGVLSHSPSPGTLGVLPPKTARDQGCGTGLSPPLGPAPRPPPWREACLSGLAPGRARHTETPLCTPHRATWKMNGSAVLGGRTTGHPGWEARVSELRPAGRSRLCRGMGPGSLGSLGGAAATPGPVPSRSCPSPTVARRPQEVCSSGRPCSPS